MRIIVAGSRTFTDYPLLKATLDKLTAKLDKKKLVLISGHAKGADKLGEQWAFENMVRYEVHIPDWSKGKQAGMLRNEEMAKVAEAAVIFWDKVSGGAKHMIGMAKKYKLETRVITFELPKVIKEPRKSKRERKKHE